MDLLPAIAYLAPAHETLARVSRLQSGRGRFGLRPDMVLPGLRPTERWLRALEKLAAYLFQR
jgi:hypothetical protein